MDSGDNLVDNPGFEIQGYGELGGEGEPMQVTFGDEPGFLSAPERLDDGVTKRTPTAMFLNRRAGIGVLQRRDSLP